MPTEIPAE